MNSFILSLFISLFGFGYFLYGKKNQKTIPLFSGIALMVYPYFITNVIWMIVVGLILVIVPFIFKN